MKLVEPRRLLVVFSGEHTGVEEDEEDDEPVERLRLDSSTASSPHSPVHSVHVFFLLREPRLLMHLALIAQLVRGVHVVVGLPFAVLHVAVLVLGIDVFRLRYPVEIAS